MQTLAVKHIPLLVKPLLLLGCSFVSWTLSAQQQCQTHQQTDASLSQLVAQHADKMATKTGVYVLEKGSEAMLSRAWLTSKAEKSIDIQYFIFTADNIGLIASDYLVQAADRGVKVRLLVDDIMIDASDDELLKIDSHPNIEIRIYNPLANVGKNLAQKVYHLATDFHDFNQRMHNKAFIVDSKMVITGGRNVADEYFGYDQEYNFRDRDVFLLGGVSKQIQSSFDQYWQHALSVPVAKLLEKSKNFNQLSFSQLHQYACDPENFLPIIRERIGKVPEVFEQVQHQEKLHWLNGVQYIADIPGKNDANTFLGGSGKSTQSLIDLVNNAKSSILIQTPYLITSDKGKKLMQAAVNRGVEVKILTNSLASTDNLEAFSGYKRDRKKLLATGVEIYEFKPDAQIRQNVMALDLKANSQAAPIFGLHAKTMVIDDNITVIGTFNMDPRSANLNTESVTVIPSKQITADVRQEILTEMAPENAWRTDEDFNPDSEAGILKRLRLTWRRVIPKSIL
ncbi:phospholipase D family protein [Thalassotalea sp. Y01]|uniref:phospholipase D family protein n=1 Tax=Thalassotalea sp. Y01 TaxID=2729613 RepID=UPI00145D089E|nr:phospholipase D family protein [Thalassotalea sp. Y01]NMP14963.1 phospholipase D family protein [Thalassotalea sp. Y01]